MNALRLALVIPLLVPLSSAAQAPSGDLLAIREVVIVDGNGGPPVENGTVLVRGSRIAAVGGPGEVAVPPGARVIDGRGLTAMPGLADMHVHLVGGWDGESMDLLGYQTYLNALLYSGITTVFDTGNLQTLILQIRNEIRNGRIRGPRLYAVGAVLDGPDPMWPDNSLAISSARQIPGLVRRQKASGVDAIKAYAGLSDPQIGALVEEARKDSLWVIVDQGLRNGSTDLIRLGIRAFGHAPSVPVTDAVVQAFQERGVAVVTTLATYESFSRRRLSDLSFLSSPLVQGTVPPAHARGLRREAERTLPPADSTVLARSRARWSGRLAGVKRLHDAGVLVVAGTDAPYPGVFYGEGLHRELELLVEAGLTPLQAITAATRSAARLMGAEREWGTLEPGRIADIVLVRGRPDRTIGHTREVVQVIQGGRVVDREALRFDPRRSPAFEPVRSTPVH